MDSVRSNWRSELVHIFIAAMEAAWLSPVLLAIGYTLAEPHVVMAGLSLFVCTYAIRLAARFIAGSALDVGRSRLLLVYGFAAAVLLALKVQNYPAASWLNLGWLGQAARDVTNLTPALGSVALTVGSVAYTWLRALRIAAVRPSPQLIFRQFQYGLLAVIITTFLAGRIGLAGEFAPYIFWFFFWGLMAVAATRLEDIARNRRTALEGYWLPIVFAVAVLVIVGGGILSAIYSQELVAGIWALLQPVGQLFEFLLFLIAVPLGYLIEWLLVLLRPILAPLLARLLNMLQLPQPQGNPIDQLLEEQRKQPSHLPPGLQEALKWIVIFLIIAWVVMVLARSLRRRQRADEEGVDEVRESVWAGADLWGALRRLWARLLGRLRPAPTPASPGPPPGLSEQEYRALLTVRQIYSRLLELAASLGRPRPAYATPYEFLGDLRLLLPASGDDLAAITGAYVFARYGTAISDEGLAELQAAWQRVRKGGEQAQAAARRQRRRPETRTESEGS